MELSLRKARKLESKIGNLINNLRGELETQKTVRVNADVQTEILPTLVLARSTFFASFDNIQELVDVRFNIRGLISEANELSGINNKIILKVTLENKIVGYNSLSKGFNVLEEKELEDDSHKYKVQLSNGDRFSRSTFDANFLLGKDTVEFKKQQVELGKQIDSLEDELLGLNYSTTIKLTNNLIALLQTNSLL